MKFLSGLFQHKKREKEFAKKEAQIQKVRGDYLKVAKKATKETAKLNKLLESDGGATMRFFLATGGDKRLK